MRRAGPRFIANLLTTIHFNLFKNVQHQCDIAGNNVSSVNINVLAHLFTFKSPLLGVGRNNSPNSQVPTQSQLATVKIMVTQWFGQNNSRHMTFVESSGRSFQQMLGQNLDDALKAARSSITCSDFGRVSASFRSALQPHTRTASLRHLGDDCCRYVLYQLTTSLF